MQGLISDNDKKKTNGCKIITMGKEIHSYPKCRDEDLYFIYVNYTCRNSHIFFKGL